MPTQTLEVKSKHIESLEDLAHEAEVFLSKLSRQTSGATLVTLSGELGAGKTTFTQHIAKTLGVKDTVNSPTFVIEKIYDTTSEKFPQLVHIDAYRLQSADDLRGIGFDQLMEQSGTLIMLEWPERVDGVSEKTAVKITLEPLGEGSRKITYA
jgi:tRNA threonylcarbamoyladenosine biosynthesis protein TsaE